LTLTGAVLSLDGKQCVKQTMAQEIPPINEESRGKEPTLGKSSILIPAYMYNAVHQGETLGEKLANALIAEGADVILEAAKQENESSK
jgi:hypothetical protein